MTASGPTPGDDDQRPEALPESEQIDDDTWSSFVDGIRWHTSSAPEVTPEEIQDVLDDEDWTPPDPEPVGWRTSSPSLVLGFTGAMGGLFVLFVLAVFVRPVPGWALIVVITVVVASAAVLFSHLPGRRDPFSDGGAV